MSKIHDDCYIVMSQYGIQRMTKRPGKLARGEVSVRVRLTLPESVFDEPAFSAHVSVPESAVIKREADVEVVAPDGGGDE
ncbi:hypothetical protein GCM10007897_45050 [Sphingobium jiangsuense]|uniref:Uncharacterized protein n=1 Tax=Sphingobium jiangsuense TaxID=870476 RepID=A0A7W6BP70_9SPHN|nr:hypothetical protein [Sphingobium jiangsuense]MBB3926198.1 hypothetical protein [Sphingobium jiangsuense]GLT03062.1 hypothetical protein GCM10007897_45050 [Sphingobium jiangsuense]